MRRKENNPEILINSRDHPLRGFFRRIKEEQTLLSKKLNEVTMTDQLKPKDLSFGVKPPLSLVPPTFIVQVARCLEDGAKKRSPYNWRASKVSAMQLLDKILRHVVAAVDGEDQTEDSKLSNLASAAADIAVYLDAEKYGSLVDDRPSGEKK